MEINATPDFLISRMRELNLPEMHFFYVTSQPCAFGSLDQVLDPLIDRLYEAKRLAHIIQSGPGPDMVRYYPAGDSSGLYIMEVGIAVPAETQPAGAAQVKALPPYRCAGVLLWGSLAHIAQAYTTLTQAMKDAGWPHSGEVRECTYSFESPVSPNNLMGIYMAIG